jgi:hypothetical protein
VAVVHVELARVEEDEAGVLRAVVEHVGLAPVGILVLEFKLSAELLRLLQLAHLELQVPVLPFLHVPHTIPRFIDLQLALVLDVLRFHVVLGLRKETLPRSARSPAASSSARPGTSP